MMLGEGPTDSLPSTTLDDLFGQVAARQPDAVALIDPPNRETFTDGAPRRLTYAEADRILTAIAARLRDLGLPTDAVIGIQLPNTVEHVLTILGVLRAGMIAAPLPLLWRRAEVSDALARIGARAIVTAARIGSFAACEMAMQVAADVFQIRHVIGFGRDLPDGVTQFDDLVDDATSAWALPWDLPEVAPTERDGNPAAHVALVTFDVTPDGIVAVARNHAELIAGGVAGASEDGTAADANILTSIALGSFGGLSLAMLPWLLRGGALSLHHGFDAEVFARQCIDDRCATVVVPGPLVPQLAEAALLAHPDADERRGRMAGAGAPSRQPRMANSARGTDRHADVRRDGADRFSPRRRRPANSAAGRRRDRPDPVRHAVAPGRDGAASRISARRVLPAAALRRRRRLRGHRLSLPHRCRGHGRR